MKVRLQNNSGYQWFTNGEVFAKGYVYDEKNTLFANQDLVEYFTSGEISFEERLKQANGIFSVVIKRHNRLKFAVDRTRTFPLFYTFEKDGLSVFDENKISKEKELDEFAVKEFKSIGLVSGKETLLKDVFQVQAGEFGEVIGQKVQMDFYFKYAIGAVVAKKSTEKDLSEIFDRTIERAITYANGRKLIVPLSAGYDSRLLLTLLRKHGYQNVLCFTYGRSNSYEVKTSEEIANILGYDWTFVEYTDELINGFSKDETFNSFFFDSGSNLSSLAHIQDFFAVKELNKRGQITKDSIFLPGHSGDFLAGSHLNKYWSLKSSEKDILKAIFKEHYKLSDYRVIYKALREKTLGNLQKGLAYSVFEDWDLKERQAKFIVNSVRVYEKFGCQYLLPLWDDEMITFFKYLPLEQKLNTWYYDNFILKGLFKEFQVDLIKPKPSRTSGVLIKLLPPKLKMILKGFFSKKVDYNNFDAVNEEFGEPKGKYINSVLVNVFLKKTHNGFQ